MNFVQPSENDLDAVKTLLASSGLPIEGVDEIRDNTLVAFEDGRLTACAGFELAARTALLRSVAVADYKRGTGVGIDIVNAVIDKARQQGAMEIVLMTTTARDFFAGKFGFTIAERQDFADTFDDSSEWNLPHCSTAVVMRKILT